MRELNVPVTTHGRVLIDEATGPLRLLVGFHGYAQNADEMLEMLRAIPADASWTRVSIQALHRFYRRSETTVASWMTRENRDVLIADNVRYVDAAIGAVADGRVVDRLVLCGFSQGAAMALRAGILGATTPDAIVAVCGDMPPELLKSPPPQPLPRVLLARGTRDEYYTEEKLAADVRRLTAAGAQVETFVFDGGHEWNAAVAARAAAFIGAAA